MIVPRTCTEVLPEDADRHGKKDSRPLKEFRDAPAYVLLGDPGSGKTTAFETECQVLGEKACLVTARDFLALDLRSHPEWRDKILFIDGLDEVRAGADDARTPFDQIRGRLDILGKPRFRLSCRQADWLGANDRRHLESVYPNSKVTVLRLDLLRDSDVAEILKSHPQVEDVEGFIATAKEQSVDGLLANPQTLKMLANVISRGWPGSRLETFQKACLQMVPEHNEEHQAAKGSNNPPATDQQLLDAAGRLCSVQLVSGAAGHTLRGEPDKEYPSPDQCDYDRREILRLALATKIYKHTSGNRFTPVHRHIAEFLGAWHLSGVIDSGLPARRVLALISGEDGIVVTEMRGLSAWLAAHCREARADLIEGDPIGVGLYGDIRAFTIDEKRALLNALKREASRLDSVWETAAAFGGLATPDMEPVLKEILTDSGREKEHQLAADFVLRVLREGEPLTGFSGALLEVVRDDTWWTRVNTCALDAFIHNCPDSKDKTSKLKALLTDVQSGSVSDPDNELLGILLFELYPQELPPSEVWGYLSEKGNRKHLLGRYWYFWEIDLLEKSSDEHVAELLDHLHLRLSGLCPALEDRHLRSLPLKLLAQGLKAHGDELDTKRLYNWLSVGSTRNRHGSLGSDEHFLVSVARSTESGSSDDQALRDVRSWLERRPEVQKAVILERLNRCPPSDDCRSRAFDINDLRYAASPPPDSGLWCLKQAVSMADTWPRVSEHFLAVAVNAHKSRIGNKSLSLKVMREYTRRNGRLRAYLNRLLAPPSIPPRQQEWQEKERAFTEEQKQQEEQWLEYVRSNEAALRENRAPPALLHQMAIRYFGDSLNVHSIGGSKDMELELRDPSLIHAALLGIRRVFDREDVPEAEEIIAVREKGDWHYLGFPFLASLAMIEEVAPEKLCRLGENQVRRALAFHYWLSSSEKPHWYRRLLNSRPMVVAEMLIQSARFELRSGSKHIAGLFALAHDPDHAQVAQHASLPLLRGFPTRCKLNQIESLNHLLWAAIQHAERSSLLELIERKLSRKSMNDPQRVRWLASGVIASPTKYTSILNDFAQGNGDRISHLAEFFCLQDRMQTSFGELRVPGLELIIRLVGSYVGSDQRWGDAAVNEKGGWVGPEMRAARLVYDLIQRLAVSPAREAGEALDSMLAEPGLSRWQDALCKAQDSQRVTWRDASYRHPTLEQVCRTLNGGSPANAGDLAALVKDKLDEIADRTRKNNANYWRPYWNEDENQKPTNPKHENSCRDALIRDLRMDFPNAEPEVRCVNEKRADIRVSLGNFQVPVEIKKNSHKKLWSASQNQLIAQYTIDPDTGGYGIYLVFWFGKDYTQTPPSGDRPVNSEELKERLKATLSPGEARKISVCVIDVCRPD